MRALFLFFLSVALWADQITLQNGDRLTGSVVKSDAKTLTFKSELAGVVTVPWESITVIDSKEPLNVTLKAGTVLVGPVTTEGPAFTVQTANAGAVKTEKAAVSAIRSQDEEKAYQAQMERLRNPRLSDLWAGSFDTGFSLARGNADIQTFTLGANAARATTRDKIAVYFTSIYAKNRNLGRFLTSANAVRGGVAYNVNINPKFYVFAQTDQEFDEFQRLDLRSVFGGGAGYNFIKNETTTFTAFGGGTFNREFFSTGLRRSSGEIMGGQELNLKLNKTTAFRERVVFYPNLTFTGEYRLQADAGLVSQFARWLSWQITASNRYITNPAPGAKTNDLLLTTGVRLVFGGAK
jgi:putative salt-induced outer membrane protein YdiY